MPLLKNPQKDQTQQFTLNLSINPFRTSGVEFDPFRDITVFPPLHVTFSVKNTQSEYPIILCGQNLSLLNSCAL